MRCVKTSTLGQDLALRLAAIAMLLAGLATAPAEAQQAADASPAVLPQLPADSSPVLPQPPRANQRLGLFRRRSRHDGADVRRWPYGRGADPFGPGLRLGANVGYLKFTERATWTPF
jgi:hypothetical protein